MKMYEAYEALQSNAGQHIAGVQIPATDAEIPIPFVDFNFENKAVLAAGIGVGVYGVVKTLRHQETTRQLNDPLRYNPGKDYAEATKRSRLKGRARDLGLGILTAVGLTSATLALASPYSEKTINEIEKASVLIAADYSAYAEDVRVGDGVDSRLDASVNVVKQMDLDGIEVEFIAVGTEPLSMGTLSNGDGSAEIVQNFKAYSSILSNRGSDNNGADFEAALAIAQESDKIIVFGSLENSDQTPVLDGEDIESRKVSTISVGEAGTKVDIYGQDNPVDAPFNPSYNALVVGVVDNFTAGSDSEIREVVGSIINDQIQTIERNDIDIFDDIARFSLLAASIGYYMKFGKKSKINTPKKGK